MLRSVKSLLGYAIRAKDGDIGKVTNFLPVAPLLAGNRAWHSTAGNSAAAGHAVSRD